MIAVYSVKTMKIFPASTGARVGRGGNQQHVISMFGVEGADDEDNTGRRKRKEAGNDANNSAVWRARL
jgi:hypothetical protein